MNRGIKVLQTSALPLGYVAILARVAGFEPASDGIRIHCLTTWLYPKVMGWMMGFEPTRDGATTRCLNHLTTSTILAIRIGLEPTTSSVTGWHSNQLNYRTAKLVGAIGLEPMTLCL